MSRSSSPPSPTGAGSPTSRGKPIGSYRHLLAGAGARRLAVASAIGWLGFGALALAIVLTVQRATGSPSAAGVALAAFSIGSGLLAPLRGRLVDRLGLRRALVPMALVSGAALVGLAAAAAADAGPAALVAPAGAAGLPVPPLIASARVIWPQVVAPEDLQPAYGVQALLGDLGGVGGPALAGALAALASPAAALVVCGVAPLAGALLLATLPWPEPQPRKGRSGALASAGMRTLVLADVALYAGFGALEVALPALADREGAAAAAAVPLAAFAAASAAASLYYGTRRARPARRYVLGALALAASLAPLALAGSVLVAALILLAGGAAFAAVNVAVFELLDTAAPPGTGAEALTWLTTAGATGTAAGAALAGHVAGSGAVGAALALPAAGAAFAAAVALARASTLGAGAGSRRPAAGYGKVRDLRVERRTASPERGQFDVEPRYGRQRRTAPPRGRRFDVEDGSLASPPRPVRTPARLASPLSRRPTRRAPWRSPRRRPRRRAAPAAGCRTA